MNKMAEVMGTTVNTMKTMEKQMPAEQLAKNMREFQIAQERLGITDDMMNDALDNILDEPGDEEEQNAIVNQVLDEIGIESQSKASFILELISVIDKYVALNDGSFLVFTL
ncbi:unnamed protein product [Cylicostephanus goldi]|uniref:Uncharacterized protein n=1 Tax=Cylicostephanus goldi TaxID=71465 RepID=A0A3P6Q3V4_CYLGO|nr:unnamed protein product [Cylicostephanus goldi]